MLAAVLATLATLVTILKLALRNMWKRVTNLIFLNICTPPHYVLTRIILFFKEIIDKANSKFDLKIKETLHMNWTKPKLNTQQNLLAVTLPLLCFFVFVVFLYISCIIFIIFMTLIFGIFYFLNYTSVFPHLIKAHLVSLLFLSSIVFIAPYINYWHLLLS